MRSTQARILSSESSSILSPVRIIVVLFKNRTHLSRESNGGDRPPTTIRPTGRVPQGEIVIQRHEATTGGVFGVLREDHVPAIVSVSIVDPKIENDDSRERVRRRNPY